MSPAWLGFFCGLFLGLPVSVVILAIMCAGARADRDAERMFGAFAPSDKKPFPRLPRC